MRLGIKIFAFLFILVFVYAVYSFAKKNTVQTKVFVKQEKINDNLIALRFRIISLQAIDSVKIENLGNSGNGEKRIFTFSKPIKNCIVETYVVQPDLSSYRLIIYSKKKKIYIY